MTEIKKGETIPVRAQGDPPDAHIASYRWSVGQDVGAITLTPSEDGSSAEITGEAAGVARVTVDTVNADGTPGPSYSEDVTVIDDVVSPPPVEEVKTGAESVTFVWGSSEATAEPSTVPVLDEGAEVAPSPSDELVGSPAIVEPEPAAEEPPTEAL